jgi:hypothetical protein
MYIAKRALSLTYLEILKCIRTEISIADEAAWWDLNVNEFRRLNNLNHILFPFKIVNGQHFGILEPEGVWCVQG